MRADIAPLLDGRTFGKTSEQGSCDVGELLRDSLPDMDKPVQRRYLEHINMLRLYLKKRAFSFADLYQTFVHYDRVSDARTLRWCFMHSHFFFCRIRLKL